MVEIEPKKARKRRHPRRPHLSPPGLPPRWGEGVAPPPTPQYPTPHVSPEATSVEDSQRPRRAAGRYLQRHHSSTYSIDNYEERRKYELQAERIREEMQARLGSHPDEIDSQNERLNALRRVDSQINELKRMSESTTQPQIPAGASARMLQQPRSANLEQLYHEAIPMNKALSHSGPSAFGNGQGLLQQHPDESASVISFTSSVHSLNNDQVLHHRHNSEIDTKIECVDSLVSLLRSDDIDNMSDRFLAMSSSPGNCNLMRQHHVVDILVKILHAGEKPHPPEIRRKAGRALHNIVHAHPEQRQCKREAKILLLLEKLRMYSDFLKDVRHSGERGIAISQKGCGQLRLGVALTDDHQEILICEMLPRRNESLDTRPVNAPHHQEHWDSLAIPCVHYVNYNFEETSGPVPNFTSDHGSKMEKMNIEETMAVLTRCSFDEAHRQPIFNLGGIRALAELIQVEREVHEESDLSSWSHEGGASCSGGNGLRSKSCTEVRRYAVVALTNLTFGNGRIKSFLCGFPGFIPIMVAQLARSTSDNLRKATAHLFRNLAWKADKSSKQTLSESNVVSVLMQAAITSHPIEPESKEEPTLKVILSALWNLSAHCKKNKADICSMNGALAFLVALLQHKSPAIVENGGGILRNVSSFIATSPEGENYRIILRENRCLEILLQQLKSSSLTIVSNACGTLWNLSARNAQDQKALWDLGAVSMLHSLTQSKHKTISTCSSAALRNLLHAKPSGMIDMVSKGASAGIPSLHARKRRNMVREMSDQLLDTPKVDVDDQESDNTDEEIEIRPMVNNFLETKENPEVAQNSDNEEIVDNPTDYSLQYQENEETEVMDGVSAAASTVQDHEDFNVKSFFTEGTPADTPRISKTNSVQDLTEKDLNDQPQLYASEGTPGCFSRVDSVENLVDESQSNQEESIIEKGQLETAENGPSEKDEKEPKKAVNFTQETPLMFSRSSSYESLNSFVQQPIQSGYSSYDISRVTSGRVSPSDLPDSPCQSRPFSPSRKQPAKGFLQTLLKSAEASSGTGHKTTAAPTVSASANTAKNTEKIDTHPGEEEEVVKTYLEEGTPAEHLSPKTSLDDLTNGLKDQPKVEDIEENDDEEDDSDDDDEDALLRLQNLGLQSLQSKTKRPTNGNMKRATARSGIPVKSANNPVVANAPSSSSRALIFSNTPSELGEEVKKFCVEGTPSWMSKSNSNTNLSALTLEDSSDESEGDDDILKDCIKTAWPAKKQAPKPAPRVSSGSSSNLGQRIGGEGTPTTQANRGLGGITTIPCPTPAASTPHQHGKGIACSTTTASHTKPRSSPSVAKVPPTPPKRAGSTLSTAVNHSDEVKIYEVEDTPVDLSSKSSFSDLTVDDTRGGRVSVDSNDGLIQHHNAEELQNQRIGVTPAFRPLNGAVSSSSAAASNARNDSLRNFEAREQQRVSNNKEKQDFPQFAPSNLPRPQVSGKSGSSSSSTRSKTLNSSSDEDSDENDALLEKCISLGISKSKSEPLDLKKKLRSQSSLVSSTKRENRTRSKSKSPRNSKVIPGVAIAELKLISPGDKPKEPPKEEPKMALNLNEPVAVSQMWDDKSPNPPMDQECNKPNLMEDSSLASSICSTLDNIQPPSLMNSLISMSERPSIPNSPKVSSKLECRHSGNLSAKKGQKVPEMVRRALELSSSFSSCQSNLDNIKPPTEMDSSILSIASISSEIADQERTVFNKEVEQEDDKTALDDVAPPTLMDEVSGAQTKTLVPDDKTYTINQDQDPEQSTCHDITDVFDETLTLGSDNNADNDVIDAPDLPRDSSRESTPGTKRRNNGVSSSSLVEREREFTKLRNYKVSVPSLEEDSMTSGYKSETPRSPRTRNEDRFKTRVITKSDLSHTDSDSSTSSPARRTIKQKREEEADRFKTQIIPAPSIQLIEEEAKHVVEIIAESKTSARSRSASADALLNDDELNDQTLNGSCDSILEQDYLKQKIIQNSGPRIRKPEAVQEAVQAEEKGIRGRRKGLYSPKKTPPQVPPKPVIAPKPKINQTKKAIPGSPRGTRSTQLRQLKQKSPPSPKHTPKSRIRAPLASPAPSTISTSSSGSTGSRLVRQGTFTKEEPSTLNAVLVDIDVDDKKPPRRPSSSASSSVSKRSPRSVESPPVIPQTRTSALRERSRSRQGSGSSTNSSTTNRSIPRPVLKSPSNQSLNSASRLGRRTPTSTEITRNKPTEISDTCSESNLSKKSGKKEVTSKIASLWKKVEDSKKKDKVDAKKDSKKVWISKGRVIPESDMAYLRPDEAQKKIITDFQKSKDSEQNNSPIKQRSRSRLSIKLSKFKSSSNPLKKENSFTYTSHLGSHSDKVNKTSTSVPSTPNVEDVVNGNTNSSKRLSRFGSFLNPEEKGKAIVPPFNYSPPITTQSPATTQETMTSKLRKPVRRNDSYVTSMGRTREEILRQQQLRQQQQQQGHHHDVEELDENGAPTSSVMVTLV